MNFASEAQSEERRRQSRCRFQQLLLAGAFGMAVFFFNGRCLAQGSFGSPTRGSANNPADLAVVVYNENDPFSRELADFYAGKRGIPSERVVGIKCSTDEEISREEYDEQYCRADSGRSSTNARLVETHAGQAGRGTVEHRCTSNRMCYLVLMRVAFRCASSRPVPIIAGDFCTKQPSPLKDANGASVDSELTVLGGFTRSQSRGICQTRIFAFVQPLPRGAASGGHDARRADWTHRRAR